MKSHSLSSFLLLLLLATASFSLATCRSTSETQNSTPKPKPKPNPSHSANPGMGIPGFDPSGGFSIPGFGSGPFNVPGFGGGWGGGYSGPNGGHSYGGVSVPSVVCSEKGPCYKKRLTCPKKCFSSYSRSGKNYGAGGGGGGCTMDCKKHCTAYC